jgi:hypothetical protein
MGGGQSISTIPAEANPASPGCLQSSFRAIRNHVTLMFGNRRQDMQSQAVGMRIVHRHELDTGIH